MLDDSFSSQRGSVAQKTSVPEGNSRERNGGGGDGKAFLSPRPRGTRSRGASGDSRQAVLNSTDGDSPAGETFTPGVICA